MKPAIPATEEERLQALHALRLLNTGNDASYDRITRMTSNLLNAPWAALTLIDRDHLFSKSVSAGEALVEVPREHAFCSYTILGDKPLVVPDARRDARFRDNPYVAADPHVRFYAGVPITSTDGHRLGALCVWDTHTRRLSDAHLGMLSDLALTVQELIRHHEARRRNFKKFMRAYHDDITVPSDH